MIHHRQVCNLFSAKSRGRPSNPDWRKPEIHVELSDDCKLAILAALSGRPFGEPPFRSRTVVSEVLCDWIKWSETPSALPHSVKKAHALRVRSWEESLAKTLICRGTEPGAARRYSNVVLGVWAHAVLVSDDASMAPEMIEQSFADVAAAFRVAPEVVYGRANPVRKAARGRCLHRR